MDFELDLDNAHCPMDKYQSHIDLFFHLERECDWVFLGDSITNAGRWSELFPNVAVSNQGIDGDTVKGILARSHLVTNQNLKVVFILAGINDIIQGRSIEQIMESYIKLIYVLRENDCKVVIQSTLFTSNPQWNAEVRLLNQALNDYAEKNNIDFLDLNKAFSFTDTISKDATFDGTHLQAAMYIKWSKVIATLNLLA